MKPIKIIQLGILATAIALIFPPIHYKKMVNGKFVDYISAGHSMIFSIPAKHYIDWTTLVLELGIILCVTFFFYYQCKGKGLKKDIKSNASISNTNQFMIPATPTVSNDWVIGGVHVNDAFYKPAIEKCIGKIISSIELPEIQYVKETKKPQRYNGQLGHVVLINNKVVVINSRNPGVTTPRGIIIGVSTIHDVINKYGMNIIRVRRKEQKHLFVYSQDSADLGFFVNDSGTVVGIEANIPLD